MIIHIFGMTNVGKTTIAEALIKRLNEFKVEHIDADNYRKTLCSDLGFSKEDRIENVRRLQELAEKSSSDIVILTAITPFNESRRDININILLEAPIEVLRQRDYKGIYNLKDGISGLDFPFEDCSMEHLKLDTSKYEINEVVDKIMEYSGIKPKYSMFVGRWQTLHDGHDWLFRQKLELGENILICIRDVNLDENNPLSAQQVKSNLEQKYLDLIEEGRIKLMIIPDITSFNYGRDVGYEVIEHIPPEEIKNISGTKIRQQT